MSVQPGAEPQGRRRAPVGRRGAITADVRDPGAAPAAAAPSSSRSWLPGIEALRGVAAMTVVLHHMWSLSSMPRFPGYWVVEGLGTWGVNLFFMLSGYLLADAFWQDQRVQLRVYAVRRFFRIAPAYYANLVLLFLFFAPNGLTFSDQGKKQIVASFTFTHYLFPGTSSSLNVNGALWTLTLEMMLYAFLPIMAIAVRFFPWPSFLVMVAIGVGWRAWIALDGDALRAFWFGDSPLDPGIQSLFIARQFIGVLPVFALGIIARWVVVRGHLDGVYRRLPSRLGVSSFLLLCIPSLLMTRVVVQASSYDSHLLFPTYDLLVMLLLLPALLLAARPDSFTESPLRTVSSWLGERSYSIYLWHFPIILTIYERGALELPPAPAGYAWRIPAVLVLTLVVASASYQLVEKPGMDLGRRLAKRLAAPTPGRTR